MDVTKETIEISWNRISRLVHVSSFNYVYHGRFKLGYMNFIAERSIAIEMLISDNLPSLEKMKYQIIEMISNGRDSETISIGTAWRRYCYLMNIIYNLVVMLCDNKRKMDEEIEKLNKIASFDQYECNSSSITISLNN